MYGADDGTSSNGSETAIVVMVEGDGGKVEWGRRGGKGDTVVVTVTVTALIMMLMIMVDVMVASSPCSRNGSWGRWGGRRREGERR